MARGSERRERGAVATVGVRRHRLADAEDADDEVAVEEPLEIRVRHAGVAGALDASAAPRRSGATVAITMRTPGRDAELAVGFLHGEGLLRFRAEVVDARGCAGVPNAVQVTLAADVPLDRFAGTRRFYTTSSCGLCGRDSLEAVVAGLRGRRVEGEARVTSATLRALPAQVQRAQVAFQRTGGLHGAALVTPDGGLVDLAEDVGRHNAVDKLVGRAWLADTLPARDRVLFLSGRAGFELVQKAVFAGIPVVAAVGAPTSLAIELARTTGLTLVGFLGADRFNVYASGERIAAPGRRPALAVR
jgi:FdhD protein